MYSINHISMFFVLLLTENNCISVQNSHESIQAHHKAWMHDVLWKTIGIWISFNQLTSVGCASASLPRHTQGLVPSGNEC